LPLAGPIFERFFHVSNFCKGLAISLRSLAVVSRLWEFETRRVCLPPSFFDFFTSRIPQSFSTHLSRVNGVVFHPVTIFSPSGRTPILFFAFFMCLLHQLPIRWRPEFNFCPRVKIDPFFLLPRATRQCFYVKVRDHGTINLFSKPPPTSTEIGCVCYWRRDITCAVFYLCQSVRISSALLY